MSYTSYNMSTRGNRESKGPPSTDFFVCFPPRTHLALMPKPIYSPARPSEKPASTRHINNRHARNLSNRGIFAGGIGHASPLTRAKAHRGNDSSSDHHISSEPTSPKVTCAGQIKIKNKPVNNWQSVMEEIERLHNKKKMTKKKRHGWAEAFGFKKDVMQFLTCLRNIRFDFRCFGAFPNTSVVVTSDDEEDEEEYEDAYEEDDRQSDRENTNCRNDQSKEETGHIDDDDDDDDDDDETRTVFSKWFMVLQEDHHCQGKEYAVNEYSNKAHVVVADDDDENNEEEEEKGCDDDDGPCMPPPNALLLMRCRSAPLKKWLQEEKDEEKILKEKEKERLLVMTCGGDFSKFSTDVVKETWVVGATGILSTGSLSRSRSCRR